MATTKKAAGNFTAEERAAMKERAKESRRGANEDLEPDVLAKIAEMAEPDRVIASRVHELVRAAAPDLKPRLYYGMPAYAKKGKVLVFFQDAGKFKARYSTLGFNDVATLDDGEMWPTSWALTKLTPEVEERITALVERAAG